MILYNPQLLCRGMREIATGSDHYFDIRDIHMLTYTKWRLFADDIIKCIFWNENVWISIKISLKFVPKGLINNIPALVQIMAWRRLGDKPLSGAMMVR